MKSTISLFLLILMASCTSKDAVFFKEPQPAGSDNLKEIPKRLRGEFLSKNDSTRIIVDANRVMKTGHFTFKTNVKNIDSGYELRGDTIYNLADKNEKTPVKRLKDSLEGRVDFADTIFDITRGQILRKFRGYYFLNYPVGQEWNVKQLTLKEGVLTFSNIAPDADLTKLNEVKENPSDTLNHHLAPTRRQFKKFVKNEGFKNGEEYVKVR